MADATITQFTGFILALLSCLFVRDGKWQMFKQVKPLYLTGGALAAVIIFSNVTAIHQIGVTLTISAVLIAQLSLTFLIDINGWFGVSKAADEVTPVYWYRNDGSWCCYIRTLNVSGEAENHEANEGS